MNVTKSNLVGQAVEEFKASSIAEKVFLLMLVFVPIVLVVDLLHFPPLLVFVIAALAVVPLAKAMSNSTEALSHHAGPVIGGLLTATFGNAVELIIAMLALTSGLTEVVKASITGSIVGNMLLVLGLSMFLGGLPRKYQVFNRTATSASASQLTLAAIALVIPAFFTSTLGNNLSRNAQDDLLENLSLLVAGILVICYIAQLFFFLRTHSYLSNEDDKAESPFPPEDNYPDSLIRKPPTATATKEPAAEEEAVWSVKRALITLITATVVVGFVSEILVSSIEPVTKQLGWTELFVGVIFLAIIGNAPEYLAAISAATKNQMNLSINIAMGSTLQLAFFVVPILVFVGLFTGQRLNLRFEEFELICIVLAIVIGNRVASDGESNWFEGLQLIGAYLIIAVAFFLHP